MTKGRPKATGSEKRGTAKKKPKAVSQAIAMPDELKQMLPTAPADLVPEMVPVWEAVMDDLAKRGANPSAGRGVDAITVRCLVDAIWSHQQATVELRKGLMLETPVMDRQTGELVGYKYVKNPAFAMQKDAAATILRYTDALGLNPSARVRLGVMELAGQSILASLQKMMQEAVE